MTEHFQERDDQHEVTREGDQPTPAADAHAAIPDSAATSPEGKRPTRARRTTPRANARRQPEGESTTPDTSHADDAGILHLPVRGDAIQSDAQLEQQTEESAVIALAAQGFTTDEAIRLIHASDRVASSREAREAEATLRRLRFTRWLIQQGLLDEFTA